MSATRKYPVDGDSNHVDPARATEADAAGAYPTPAPMPPAPDPFDPASLRISPDFATTAGVRKHILNIPVRKPTKETFVRTHPDPAYSLDTLVLELKDGDREIYLIAPALRAAVASEPTVGPRRLITAVDRQGNAFLWPVRLPGPDGRVDTWNQSALEAAAMAGHAWVRVTPNMTIGAYDVATSTGILTEPEFPTISLGEILRIAFKDRCIDSFDHPVLRRLRGES
jgi:hypothetical protein